MKKDGFLTGLVLGGMLGLTFSLLMINVSKPGKKEQGTEDQKKKAEKIPQVRKVADKGQRPAENSEETAEKEKNNEEETRNTEREKMKKAEKEGSSFGEDIVSKLNFSRKITQLEEALKKLREENV
ncbi:MAG: hypothetical protein GX175_03705 [Halanaerobiaceae bacterium]|nr:hypothetical protein [Halanaerobiaceae bacterium]